MLEHLNWIAIAGGTRAQRARIMLEVGPRYPTYVRINTDTDFAEMVATVLTELGRPTGVEEIIMERRTFGTLMNTLHDILNLDDGDVFIRQFVMKHFDHMQSTPNEVILSGVTTADQAFQLRQLGFFVVELLPHAMTNTAAIRGILPNGVVDARLPFGDKEDWLMTNNWKAITDAILAAPKALRGVAVPAGETPLVVP